ncbi:MAG: putative DNA binding domain-containing protein [Prevotella sp.]|nr:putative DNA binding domain-containing protein [Prevotella sp.]
MKTDEIIEKIKLGEDSQVQFKERALDRYDIGCEMVAFSNTHGGVLVIGVNDKSGDINPLSYTETQETTNLLSNIASENVVPSILIETKTVGVADGSLVVAYIKEGMNKPYHDNKGVVWVKNGSDKRKVFDNVELAEMMTDCGSFAPDEAVVRDATLSDLDEYTIKTFLASRFDKVLQRKGLLGDKLREASLDTVCSAIANGHDTEKLLRNLRLIRPDGKLTMAAMLLFGKYTQRWLPMMTAKCICFAGNSVGGTVFRDKVNDADMEGNLLHQFETIMDFFTRNLHNVQNGEEFNSMGRLEIPYKSLLEFTVNALVHRSLNLKSPVRVFIFDNRVEIHSPGTLPNGLKVEDITNGTSMPRNSFLFNNAIYLLPYTGAGSGVRRALEDGLNARFDNDESTHEFVITIARDGNNSSDLVTKLSYFDSDHKSKSNQVGEESNQVDEKSNQVQGKSNQVQADLVTTRQLQLTNKQKDILNFCSVPRTAAEIMERLGISNQSRNRAAHITPLVEAGYLELTNPENPTASNQRYRKKR